MRSLVWAQWIKIRVPDVSAARVYPTAAELPAEFGLYSTKANSKSGAWGSRYHRFCISVRKDSVGFPISDTRFYTML